MKKSEKPKKKKSSRSGYRFKDLLKEQDILLIHKIQNSLRENEKENQK